jgi:spore coat protein H
VTCLRQIESTTGVFLAVAFSMAVSSAAPAERQGRPAGWTPETHGSNAIPNYERVFSLDRVHELRISISPEVYRSMREDLQELSPMGAARSAARGRSGGAGAVELGARGLRMTARDPRYVPVTVEDGDHTWTNVGMRYKGNSSLVFGSMFDGKLSFRLNFDRFEDLHREVADQRFHGFNELTFSSNFDDPSHVREALANEIFRDRGVPAPRVAFYRILVNTGDGFRSWGLYTAVEDPADEAMLRTQFGDASGNLYKPDGPGANWEQFDPAGFEKKTNKSRVDFDDVKAAIAALHANAAPEAWRANLEKVFDVDGFLRWLAVNQVVDNWDTYGRLAHNYYLYGVPNQGGRLAWIPWDNNYSLGLSPFGFANLAGISIDRVQGGGPFLFSSNPDVLFENVGSDWPLISKLLADQGYRSQYRMHLRAALGGLYSKDALTKRVREWQTMLAPIVESEPPARSFSAPQSLREALDGPQGLFAKIDARRKLIEAALAKPRA